MSGGLRYKSERPCIRNALQKSNLFINDLEAIAGFLNIFKAIKGYKNCSSLFSGICLAKYRAEKCLTILRATPNIQAVDTSKNRWAVHCFGFPNKQRWNRVCDSARDSNQIAVLLFINY
jgi:hypothetical protein